jgi:hypothetical protein
VRIPARLKSHYLHQRRLHVQRRQALTEDTGVQRAGGAAPEHSPVLGGGRPPVEADARPPSEGTPVWAGAVGDDAGELPAERAAEDLGGVALA